MWTGRWDSVLQGCGKKKVQQRRRGGDQRWGQQEGWRVSATAKSEKPWGTINRRGESGRDIAGRSEDCAAGNIKVMEGNVQLQWAMLYLPVGEWTLERKGAMPLCPLRRSYGKLQRKKIASAELQNDFQKNGTKDDQLS